MKDSEVLSYKSAVTKRHRLERVHEEKQKEFKKYGDK